MTSAASAAVVADELTKTFGDFTAVDGVSFRVGTGEIFGFLGPNGAGKTTTIKMLAGLLVPTSGGAVVAGHDVARDAYALKRRIGYMSQLFSLYGDLTVDENIAFSARLYGVSGSQLAARSKWVLEMAGLTDHRRSLTATLPLGWKQRLALGCAFLHEPAILFLDEPTSGVDPVSRRQFWDLIHEIAAGGTAVLVTTHYMEEAEYCHRLALMNRGRLIALDTPRGLREAADEPILEVVVDESARATELLRDLPGVIDAAMFGRAVHAAVRDVTEARQRIEQRLESEGLRIERIGEIAPSLEDIFVARVRAAGGAVSG